MKSPDAHKLCRASWISGMPWIPMQSRLHRSLKQKPRTGKASWARNYSIDRAPDAAPGEAGFNFGQRDRQKGTSTQWRTMHLTTFGARDLSSHILIGNAAGGRQDRLYGVGGPCDTRLPFLPGHTSMPYLPPSYPSVRVAGYAVPAGTSQKSNQHSGFS